MKCTPLELPTKVDILWPGILRINPTSRDERKVGVLLLLLAGGSSPSVDRSESRACSSMGMTQVLYLRPRLRERMVTLVKDSLGRAAEEETPALHDSAVR